MCENVISAATVARFRVMMAESPEGLEKVLGILEKMARKEFLGFSFEQRLYSLVLAEFRDEISMLIGISFCSYCEGFVFPEAPHIWCEKMIDRLVFGEEPIVPSLEDYSCTSDFDDDELYVIAAYQPQYLHEVYMYT